MQSRRETRLLSRVEVEEQYGIPKRYLEIAATRGEGPSIVRIGRLVRYRVCDIQKWLENSVEDMGNA
ncbi:helix-turn-helix transcriptional regulator [Shimia aestuarii]|uniref:Transcriptional regulator, AlpA family n=1 Tax=Shimia aestuarii TaxID=254406 RepID=A0A1I4RPU8_9RHOB|nr:hypothetical protein [Shimia aestuarii]SFM54238.1 hypothetical protein SAMN04488042_108169 [Shimia aestuarii]